jgi:threonylcarbamoyladenosine tRNA methylthiotransferase MtaB
MSDMPLSESQDRVEVVTFGCRLNSYESEVIRRQASAAGLSDAVIVNTCAVTAEAERQARQAIRRLRRERPEARLIVTGCAAQVRPAAYAAMDEVDQVVGNIEKLDPATFGVASPPRVRVADIMTVRETAGHLVEGFDGRARAFLEIQSGCNHRCTFCIIPFGRGNCRSVPVGHVVAEAERLVARGCREIVLTGVDIGDYGSDLPARPTLASLVARLLDKVTALGRLRLSSLDPAEMDDDLLRLFATQPRLTPHVHLSLQSGDDTVLKRMKRRHTRAQAIELCRALRAARPGIVIGADFIAGFPTETEAMFENSLALVAEADLALLHVFPYSARQGTPAARMPQVPVRARRRRAEQLRRAGQRQLALNLDRLRGAPVDVLGETDVVGRTEHYLPIVLDRPPAPGVLVAARVVARDGLRLTGVRLDG